MSSVLQLSDAMEAMVKQFKDIPIFVLLMSLCSGAMAGEIKIVKAEFVATVVPSWSVNVTLQHADTGWEHYADNWRVVTAEGTLLGDRVLYHPHVNEQPFTRSLGGSLSPKAPQGFLSRRMIKCMAGAGSACWWT